MTDNTGAQPPAVEVHTDPDLTSKGLAKGKVGTFSGAILGISCVAPGYTLTASIGRFVTAVGLKMPPSSSPGSSRCSSPLRESRTELARWTAGVIHVAHQGIWALSAGCAAGVW